MARIKLSDAIMLNGVSKPQGFGPQSVYSIDAPCAIGGALQAIGKHPTAVPYPVFQREWPWTRHDMGASCPACALIPFNYVEAIWHLNDGHRWTRQQIAEWVARIEPQEPEQTIEELVETAEVVK